MCYTGHVNTIGECSKEAEGGRPLAFLLGRWYTIRAATERYIKCYLDITVETTQKPEGFILSASVL